MDLWDIIFCAAMSWVIYDFLMGVFEGFKRKNEEIKRNRGE
jgi:hypothetical protein